MTTEEFLQQARDDADKLWVSGVEARPYVGNSWIESAEIRYSDDNGRNNKQGLALRLEPKGFTQKSAEDAILSLRQRRHDLVFDSILTEALKVRYGQLLDLLIERSMIDRLERQMALLESEMQLQQNLAYTKDFRPHELLKSEVRADQLREEMQLHRNRLSDLRNRLQINRLPENIVTIDDMLAVVSMTPMPQAGSDVQTARLKLEMARQQRRLDRARQGVSVNLLELKYERADRQEDVLGMSFGIHIPFGGGFATSKRALDVADAMLELQLQQRTQLRSAGEESEMLQWQKKEVDAIRVTLESIGRRIQLAKMNGNAEMLLVLHKQQLEEQNRLEGIRDQALRHFINYLAITGQLSESPLRNWLIQGRPIL